MDAAQVKVLATELETTLGLLAELIAELQGHRAEWSASPRIRELVHLLAGQPNLSELPAVLLRAHAEISAVMGGIRLTREAIEAHAVERIRDTRDKLSSVTATTENATVELMNGLDRSLEMISHLERQANHADAGERFQVLRDQVSALYNLLQFQDITTQQLEGVGHALLDLETRIGAVSALFDRTIGARSERPASASPASSAHLAFNPDATMQRSRADQAAIDAAFQGARNGNAGSVDPIRA
ncbi:MAG: hypothetical protein ABI587_00340 [Gemmatimonadales bacterium]